MSSNTVAIIEMLKLLNEDCVNIKAICEHTGLFANTVVRYIKLLHKRRLIRIAEWHRYGNCYVWVASYEWNPDGKKDVPKPAKMTQAERQQRYRDKKQARAIGIPLGV